MTIERYIQWQQLLFHCFKSEEIALYMWPKVFPNDYEGGVILE